MEFFAAVDSARTNFSKLNTVKALSVTASEKVLLHGKVHEKTMKHE